MARFHSSKALFLFKYTQNLQLTNILNVRFGGFWQTIHQRVPKQDLERVLHSNGSLVSPADHPTRGASADFDHHELRLFLRLLQMELYSTHFCGEASLCLVWFSDSSILLRNAVCTRGISKDSSPAWRLLFGTAADAVWTSTFVPKTTAEPQSRSGCPPSRETACLECLPPLTPPARHERRNDSAFPPKLTALVREEQCFIVGLICTSLTLGPKHCQHHPR